MIQTRFTPDFCSKVVQGFCCLTPPQLTALKEELGLAISGEGLRFCQRRFTATRRDPLVGDLLFLSALATRLYRLPETMLLQELHFEDPAAARVWQDICRKRDTLGKENAPTLPDVMQTASLYLARAGRTPANDALFCGTTAELAAATQDGTLDKALEIAGIAVSLAENAPRQTPAVGQLLVALSPDADATLAETALRFQRSFTAFSPIPVTVIGEEGLGVHLTRLPFGAEFDTMYLPSFAADDGTAALVDACRNTVIYAVRAECANIMLMSGAPLKLIGRVIPHDMIVLRAGVTVMLSLPRELLAAWHGAHAISLTLPRETPDVTPATVQLTAADGQVFAGVRTEAAALPQLMQLLAKAFTAGADFKQISLAATLTLPSGNELPPHALSLLLDYHRFSAELALPAAQSRVITAPAGAAPALTVFLVAKAAPAPSDAAQTLMQEALAAGDFEQVRTLIYHMR